MLAQALFQHDRGVDQVPSFLQQQLASVGQSGAVATAIEQGDVQVLLELLHGVGDRRGHTMQLVGRSRETSLAVDRIQHQQGIE